MVKKFCSSNPNEATDEFDYASSRPDKRRINLSYAETVSTPVNHSKYVESEPDNIDLASKEPSILTRFTSASKILELENIIKSIELDRVSINTAQSTISGEMKQVTQAASTPCSKNSATI
jgi:hypothetical protein